MINESTKSEYLSSKIKTQKIDNSLEIRNNIKNTITILETNKTLADILNKEEENETIEIHVNKLSDSMKVSKCKEGYLIKTFKEWIVSLNPNFLKINKKGSENFLKVLKRVYHDGYYNLPNPAENPFNKTIALIQEADEKQGNKLKSIDFSKLQDMSNNTYFDSSTWELYDKNNLYQYQEVNTQLINTINDIKNMADNFSPLKNKERK